MNWGLAMSIAVGYIIGRIVIGFVKMVITVLAND